MKWQICLLLSSLMFGCAMNETKVVDYKLETIVKNSTSSRFPSNERGPLNGNYDGCYELYTKQGNPYLTLCFDGTMEEGIGGAAARSFLLHARSDLLVACGKSSAINITDTSFEYEINGVKEIVLTNMRKNSENSSIIGEAIIGRLRLDLMVMDKEESSQILKKSYENSTCKKLNAGELVRL